MALTRKNSTQMDTAQTLRATTALLRKIQSDEATQTTAAEKANLLEDADEDEASDETPVWLVLSTKKHIVDKKRLKPGKIQLPHPYLNTSNLRICLITADPQRTYKDLIAHESFPLELAKKIGRVIGMSKLKAKYKSAESRRQLASEYDLFLADNRIITYLPQVLGKIFYKGGSKRPIPVSLEGKRQNIDEQGNKRRKLAEGGTKVVKSEVQPTAVAQQIQHALSSTLVHLAPSTTTAVKVGISTMEAQQLQENVEAVTEALVESYIPQKWANVRAVHIKGPRTAALPIYMAEQLWEDEKDVLEEPLPVKETKKSKRKAGALAEAAEVIEVPGPDGKMRRIEKTAVKQGEPDSTVKTKKRKSETVEDADAKAAEKADKTARKEALQKQKAAAKASVNGAKAASVTKATPNGDARTTRKTRMKAADLL